MYIKLRENIGISIQIYKSTNRNPGSNKVVYASCEQKSIFFIVMIFEYAKSHFCYKKLLVQKKLSLLLLGFYVSQKRLDE